MTIDGPSPNEKRRRLNGEGNLHTHHPYSYQNMENVQNNKNGVNLDTNLYSRQIGTFGFETMGKLIQMKVLISGLKGVGIEAAKNIILAGPKCVCVHDDNIVQMNDLGSNFYLKEQHVNKSTRADACVDTLQELNHYVDVKTYSGNLNKDILSNFDIVFVSGYSKNELIYINNICHTHTPPIGFIAADCFGLSAYIFVDFGPSFICLDKDGEEPKTNIISGITQDKNATVCTHTDEKFNFVDGDYVVFKEVIGMDEINSQLPYQIKSARNSSFVIGDTTQFNPYISGGIVKEVKMPIEFKFKTFEESFLFPLPNTHTQLITPDLGKFGRPEQLHYAHMAVLQYKDTYGRLPNHMDECAVQRCMHIATQLSQEATHSNNPLAIQIDSIDEKVVKNVAFYASAHISPMASFIGGIASQEIVKYTGKYQPLYQWLHFDTFEALPEKPPQFDGNLISRHYDQISIWGSEFQQKLADTHIFLVGAGALGCEFLKSFAMMGCAEDSGLVTVTDMDNIEVSNLNRQFLFRMEHVGKSKSTTAATMANKMNSKMKIKPMETKVDVETEDTFDDEFWESKQVIVNALDNVKSRQYVDSKCVWFSKPNLESGTLGTKANVQTVLPFITESYGDSQDPPEQSIPLCTLKHFPHQIEHTVEWARDLFEGLFCTTPQETKNFVSTPENTISRITTEGTSSTQRERLEKIESCLKMSSAQNSLEMCVHQACKLFQKHFNHQILQLLYNFPLHHVTSSGQPFWSGPKRPPTHLPLDIEDPMTFQFIKSATNLYAYNMNFKTIQDDDIIKKIAKTFKWSDFQPQSVRIKVDDNDPIVEGMGDDDMHIQSLKNKLLSYKNFNTMELQPAVFEKDDDSNFHISFITACANLRARNYKIEECTFHKAKMIAGKIIPAIATTTAMVSGLVCLEFYKLIYKKNWVIEDFRNGFINLSEPLIILSEPVPARKVVDKEFDPIAYGPVKARPNGYTSWDKVIFEKKKATIQDLLDFFKENYDMDVSIVSCGNSCLYTSFLPKHRKERLNTSISELYETISKSTINPKVKYLNLEVSGSDTLEGVDVITPAIKFIFK